MHRTIAEQLPPDVRDIDLRWLGELAPGADALGIRSIGYSERPVKLIETEIWYSTSENLRQSRLEHLHALCCWLQVQGTLPVRSFLRADVREPLRQLAERSDELDVGKELAVIDAMLDQPVRELLPSRKQSFSTFCSQLRRWANWRGGTQHLVSLVGELKLAGAVETRGFPVAMRTFGWAAGEKSGLEELSAEFGVSRQRLYMLRNKTISYLRRQEWLHPLHDVAWRILESHDEPLRLDEWHAMMPLPARRAPPWNLRILRELGAAMILPTSTWIKVDGVHYVAAGSHDPGMLRDKVDAALAELSIQSMGFALYVPPNDEQRPSLLVQVARHDPDWMPLGNGWWAPRVPKSCEPVKAVARLIAAFGPMPLEAVQVALSRLMVGSDSGSRFVAPPPLQLGKLLADHGFSVSPGGEVAAGKVALPTHFSRVERLVLQSFKNGTTHRTLDELIALGRRKRIADWSVRELVDSSPLVRSVDDGYSLAGDKVLLKKKARTKGR
ncbi:MAG: hypothetical protein U0974_02920 [Gemmatimonadales bacterium]|nr:hypothetical protein [Gemmatimonadales bacterium]MDZ4388666.1 hypothetical protein [Gemmatimonadales bacterium]